MSKKLRMMKREQAEVELKDEVLEPVPVPVEPEKPIIVSKQVQSPILQIEEVARGFRQYRPHHLQSILSFCNARGYPIQGTKEQLLEILSHFGW